MEQKEQRRRKTLKELTLLDRFLFDEVLEDRETYQAVLEIILGREVRLKEAPQSEKESRTLPSYRGIRMDVWGRDEEETVYNSEMQKKNTKNLPRRSRYYQAVLDAGLLEPGSIDFNEMKDVCLITIAPFDLFGKGRCVYTFRMKCEEDSGVNLNDGAVRMFLYTRGEKTEGISQELFEFLRYVESMDGEYAESSGSLRMKCLHERVMKVKASEESEVRYMQLWEEKAMERKEGLETGIQAFIEDNLEEGISMERIAVKLQKRFGLDAEKAAAYLERFAGKSPES